MEGSTNKAFDPEGTQIEIEDLQLTESVTLTFQNGNKSVKYSIENNAQVCESI